MSLFVQITFVKNHSQALSYFSLFAVQVLNEGWINRHLAFLPKLLLSKDYKEWLFL